eukprot:CAMPEP_0181089190 /NCGR_PEP_ID=MMETSP1071-20121207/7173_1 /TAXON_ID=35127 /ORGANISM="Thalassiosira sp., Strain NH16" /LENGTH=457 /DNA_ID=CAMNT_0023171127 /DNA_START=250 /DNA_END=1623 /DNA_ORIENTATION=+
MNASFVKPAPCCTRYSRFLRSCQSHQLCASNCDDIDEEHGSGINDGIFHKEDNPVKTRFRARVSYLGTQFHGWQLQSNTNRSTVQGEIEGVLARRFGRRIPVLGAGRTDAGVHARGQAIHFDLFSNEMPFDPPKRPQIVGEPMGNPILMIEKDQQQTCTDFCHELQHSMNRMTMLDIRLFNLQLAPYTQTFKKGKDIDASSSENKSEAAENCFEPQKTKLLHFATRPRPWHAIQSASSKWYSYRFILGPTLWNPMDRFTRTHFVHRPMFALESPSNHRPSKSASIEPYAITQKDIDRLQAILRLYEGTHDFKAFGGKLEQNEKRAGMQINTIRTVYKVELVKEPLKESYQFGIQNHADNNKLPRSQEDQLTFIGEEGNYRIDFLLQGALYKMVRNMVGTAMEVWLGRLTEERLIALLRNVQDGRTDDTKKFRRKDNPCKPAPPEGLTLECVYYDDDF